MKLKNIGILILLIIFAGCSAISGISDIKEEIEFSEIYSWVNLMPGGDPKFHITGDVEFIDDSNFDLQNHELEAIKIYQNNRMIYLIKPNVKIEKVEGKGRLIFNSSQGYKVVPDFNYENPINVELIFKADGENYSYFIENHRVDKVY